MLDSLGLPESSSSSAAVGGGLFERQDSARVAVWGRGRARGSRSALWSRRRGASGAVQQGLRPPGGRPGRLAAKVSFLSYSVLFHFASQCFSIPSISMDKSFSEVLHYWKASCLRVCSAVFLLVSPTAVSAPRADFGYFVFHSVLDPFWHLIGTWSGIILAASSSSSCLQAILLPEYFALQCELGHVTLH